MVMEEVYNLGFSPCTDFYKYGFSYFPSMRVALPLNQILALVACGLCDSQDVMMFLNCVLWLHIWFLWWSLDCWILCHVVLAVSNRS
jgi:hypothetical protein